MNGNPLTYFPILKTKPAELTAVEKLSSKTWVNTRPIFEVTKTVVAPSLSAQAGANEITKIFSKALPTSAPFYVDLDLVNKPKLLSLSVAALSAKGFEIAPCVSLSSPASVLKEVREVNGSKGLALRLTMADLTSEAPVRINSLLDATGCSLSDVRLIVDLGAIQLQTLPLLSTALPLAFTQLPKDWQGCCMGASAMPVSIPVSTASIGRLRRLEWSLWKDLFSHFTAMGGHVGFADYAGQSESELVFDPKKMTVAVKFIYTTEDEWIVVKGRSTRTLSAQSQSHPLCKKLVEMPEFKGRDFSWGDEWIYKCSIQPNSKPGSPGTWKQVAINHHVTLVADQLANFRGA